MKPRPPSGEKPEPDVLASGSEREPRFTSAARRRLRLGIVAIIVSGAAVAGGVEVQERRVAAAEARRVAGLFHLSAYGPYGFGLKAKPPSLSAVLDMTISVRNDGPEDVTIARASAGGFVLLAPVLLPARTSRELVLHEKLDCTADTLLPPPPPLSRATPDTLRWPGDLQVTATTPQDTHPMTFARPPYNHEREAVTCDRLRSSQPNTLGGPATREPLAVSGAVDPGAPRHRCGVASVELPPTRPLLEADRQTGHEVALGIADEVRHDPLARRVAGVAEIRPEPVAAGEADVAFSCATRRRKLRADPA